AVAQKPTLAATVGNVVPRPPEQRRRVPRTAPRAPVGVSIFLPERVAGASQWGFGFGRKWAPGPHGSCTVPEEVTHEFDHDSVLTLRRRRRRHHLVVPGLRVPGVPQGSGCWRGRQTCS